VGLGPAERKVTQPRLPYSVLFRGAYLWRKYALLDFEPALFFSGLAQDEQWALDRQNEKAAELKAMRSGPASTSVADRLAAFAKSRP